MHYPLLYFVNEYCANKPLFSFFIFWISGFSLTWIQNPCIFLKSFFKIKQNKKRNNALFSQFPFSKPKWKNE